MRKIIIEIIMCLLLLIVIIIGQYIKIVIIEPKIKAYQFQRVQEELNQNIIIVRENNVNTNS